MLCVSGSFGFAAGAGKMPARQPAGCRRYKRLRRSRDFDGTTLADFKNPQQEPGMERRLLLVFAITFLIILASQPLLKKYGPKVPETPAPTQNQTQNQASNPATPAT